MPHQTASAPLAGNTFGTFGPFAFDCLGIGVQNPGSTWLTIPAIGASIAPFTFSGMIAFSFPRTSPILIRTDTAPPGFKLDTSSVQTASLIFYEDSQAPSPGFQAPGTGATRWNVNNFPPAGTKAAAGQNGIPGVVHVCDSFSVAVLAATNAPGQNIVQASVIDLSLAANLWSRYLGIPNVVGQGDHSDVGPGLQMRPSLPGAGLQITFGVGVANANETVSMTGYDQ